jgi:hypothetical protein
LREKILGCACRTLFPLAQGDEVLARNADAEFRPVGIARRDERLLQRQSALLVEALR